MQEGISPLVCVVVLQLHHGAKPSHRLPLCSTCPPPLQHFKLPRPLPPPPGPHPGRPHFYMQSLMAEPVRTTLPATKIAVPIARNLSIPRHITTIKKTSSMSQQPNINLTPTPGALSVQVPYLTLFHPTTPTHPKGAHSAVPGCLQPAPHPTPSQSSLIHPLAGKWLLVMSQALCMPRIYRG